MDNMDNMNNTDNMDNANGADNVNEADNKKKGLKFKKKKQTANNKTDRILREIWEWAYTIALAFIIVFAVKMFILDLVRVDGSSMYPTLVDGDRLIVTKLGYKPEVGDIVILDSTYKEREEHILARARSEGKEDYSFFERLLLDIPDNLEKRYFVKRVIALPGQTVDIKDGKVYVDGELLQEEYYTGTTPTPDPTVSFPLVVDENTVFVMGDNRPNSTDSRFSSLGLVPYDALFGKSQIRIWPLSEISITR